MGNISNESVILQYKLIGFEQLKLEENAAYELSNPNIKSICFSDDLKLLTVVLNNNIHYEDKQSEIESYLNHICFNLIAKTEAEINFPLRQLESIKDGSNIIVKERMHIHDTLTIVRTYPADYIYQAVVDSPTAIESQSVMYERIFKTLHNPNSIVQFMSLYQFLMELLSRDKPRVEQKHVVEYFRANSDKYPFVTFKPTRRENIRNPFDEDCFTYIRNEIGHSEDTNDLSLYQSLGSQIT